MAGCNSVSGWLQCDVPDGGIVPKSLYMADDEIDTDESSFRVDNVYHTAYVQKDYAHEVGEGEHPALFTPMKLCLTKLC